MARDLQGLRDQWYVRAIPVGLAVASGLALFADLRGSFWLSAFGAPMAGSFLAGLVAHRGVRGGIKAGFGVSGLFLGGTVLYLAIGSVYGDALNDIWLFGFIVLFALYVLLLSAFAGAAGAVGGLLVGTGAGSKPSTTASSPDAPEKTAGASRAAGAPLERPRVFRGIGEGYLLGVVVGGVVINSAAGSVLILAVPILTLTVPFMTGVLAGYRSRGGDAATGLFCGLSAAVLLALSAGWYVLSSDPRGSGGIVLLLIFVGFGLALGGAGGIVGALSRAEERRASGE